MVEGFFTISIRFHPKLFAVRHRINFFYSFLVLQREKVGEMSFFALIFNLWPMPVLVLSPL